MLQPIRGKHSRTIDRLVAKGKAVRITPGLALPRQPTPRELAGILNERYPGTVLDGGSAVAVYTERKLEFPLQLMAARHARTCAYFSTRRATPKGPYMVNGLNACNPLQALEMVEEDKAIEFLERFCNGKGGHQRLAFYKEDFQRFPARTRRIMQRSVIGSDSKYERLLTQALADACLAVANNQRIGPYYWDIVLAKEKVAIEIDGYEYHKGERIQRFELDRQKLNDAVQRGWKPLHFTAGMIEHHLQVAVDQVIAVARGGGQLLPPAWKWHHYFRYENARW